MSRLSVAQKGVPGAPFSTADLRQVLAASRLPTLPECVVQIIELCKDPNVGPHEIALPIENDPGLTSHVLRFVNSSYFGLSHQVSSIRRAITLVGVQTIHNFVLWNAVISRIGDPKCRSFQVKDLWHDSLRRGLFARLLAKQSGLEDGDELFTAALLQDMALPVLAKAMPEDYAQLLEDRHAGMVRLSVLERQTFGWTHAEAAAAMARKWNFPESLATLVEAHLAVGCEVSGPDPDFKEFVVAVSALLPSVVDPRWTELPAFETCCRRIRLPEGPALPELLDQVDFEVAQIATALQMSTPGRTLAESFHQDALALDEPGPQHGEPNSPSGTRLLKRDAVI